MVHIVIIGGGVGGVSMAYDLRKAVGRKVDITLVSDRPEFQFTPSNPWVGVGWRKPKAITLPLEKYLKRKRIRFTGSGASRVDPKANEVLLGDGTRLPYDYLVIATGPDLAFDEIQGLGPDGGYTHSVCTTGHAADANKGFEALLKNPGPIVIGAAQGASCFGPAYEYAFILDTALRKAKIRDKVPMTYVTAEPYIGHLGLDGVGDTKSILESELRQRHIKWITNAKISSVEEGQMHVEEINDDGSVKRAETLPFAYSMVLPAFRGVEAVRDIEGLVNPRGFVIIDKHQRNPTYPNIFGLGVCVAIPPMGKTPVPVGVPKTGYMIESMAEAAAHNIRDLLKGREPSHEATWNALCLADFGDNGVAFLAMPQIPPRNTQKAWKGRWVHWAKVLFEWYFLRKVKRGTTETGYERFALWFLGVRKVK